MSGKRPRLEAGTFGTAAPSPGASTSASQSNQSNASLGAATSSAWGSVSGTVGQVAVPQYDPNAAASLRKRSHVPDQQQQSQHHLGTSFATGKENNRSPFPITTPTQGNGDGFQFKGPLSFQLGSNNHGSSRSPALRLTPRPTQRATAAQQLTTPPAQGTGIQFKPPLNNNYPFGSNTTTTQQQQPTSAFQTTGASRTPSGTPPIFPSFPSAPSTPATTTASTSKPAFQSTSPQLPGVARAPSGTPPVFPSFPSAPSTPASNARSGQHNLRTPVSTSTPQTPASETKKPGRKGLHLCIEDFAKLKEHGERNGCAYGESLAKGLTNKHSRLELSTTSTSSRRRDVSRLCLLPESKFRLGIGFISDSTSDHRLHVVPTGEEGDKYLEEDLIRPLGKKLGLVWATFDMSTLKVLKMEIEKSSIVCGNCTQRLKDTVDKILKADTHKDISELQTGVSDLNLEREKEKHQRAIDNSMKMSMDQTKWVANQIKPPAPPQTTLTDDEGNELFVGHFRYNNHEEAKFELDYKDKGIFKHYYPVGSEYLLTEKVFERMGPFAKWQNNAQAYFDEIVAFFKLRFYICGTSIEAVVYRAFEKKKMASEGAQTQGQISVITNELGQVKAQVFQLVSYQAMNLSKTMDGLVYNELLDHFQKLGVGKECSEGQVFSKELQMQVATKGFYFAESSDGKGKLIFKDEETSLHKEVVPQGTGGDESIKRFIRGRLSEDATRWATTMQFDPSQKENYFHLLLASQKDGYVNRVLQEFFVCGSCESTRVELVMNALLTECLQAETQRIQALHADTDERTMKLETKVLALEEFAKNENQFRKHLEGILQNFAKRGELEDTIKKGLAAWKNTTEMNWEKFIFKKDDFNSLLKKLSTTGELPHPAYFYSKNCWVNSELRKGEMSEDAKKEAAWLAEELNKDEPSGATYVYRGMDQADLPPEVRDMLHPGKIFFDPGFMSTSLCKNQAWHFAAECGQNGPTLPGDRLLLEIKHKTGVDVSNYVHETYQEEQEVLFLPNQTFRVIARKEEDFMLDEKCIWIDLEEL